MKNGFRNTGSIIWLGRSLGRDCLLWSFTHHDSGVYSYRAQFSLTHHLATFAASLTH